MVTIKPLVIFMSLLLLVCPCLAANTTVVTHIENAHTTPITVWAGALILGVVLFLYTLKVRTSTQELEADAAVSIISWLPIAFTAHASFGVDRIVSSFAVPSGVSDYTIYENHIIYHFDIIGILFGVFLLIAIINTARIVALHKSLRLQRDNTE